jgi:hypothetical protein
VGGDPTAPTIAGMILHFAYGSNMSRALMARRCPQAQALGIATLPQWRFHIMPEGYGSITPCAGDVVYGVLWRLTPRDLAAINAYESLDSGLYGRRLLPVRFGAGRRRALVYVGGRLGTGTPRPGYITLVVDAAREWNLPVGYVRSLQRWSPSGWRGTRRKDVGELA